MLISKFDHHFHRLFRKGAKPTKSPWPSHGCGRYPRLVLRFRKNVGCGRQSHEDKIPFLGGLRRQGLFLLRSGHAALFVEIKLSFDHLHAQREPWMQVDDAILQLQSRVSLQIRLRDLRIIYGDLWRSTHILLSKRQILSTPWRNLSWAQDYQRLEKSPKILGTP